MKIVCYNTKSRNIFNYIAKQDNYEKINVISEYNDRNKTINYIEKI